MSFNQAKAAQASARFLSHANGQLAYIKLIKLLYLAERESLGRFHSSITNDRLVSFRNGPALSCTANAASGEAIYLNGVWADWVQPRIGNTIRAVRHAAREDLDELSDEEVAVLDKTWEEFGQLSVGELIEYTHAHCPEWIDPGNGVRDISYEAIFRSFGKDAEVAAYLAKEIEDDKSLDRLLARVG